ncbi:hypothetical protein LSAT2_008030 [Lamellibrachia satsuma]|nr:hypothetical protein LSAT2_008030 [Lamellibrachia satsuma]
MRTTQYVRCRRQFTVRFVMLYIKAPLAFISMREVEVYGKKGPQYSAHDNPSLEVVASRFNQMKLKNWALRNPTKQSTSPQRMATSSKAVDGFDYTYSATS